MDFRKFDELTRNLTSGAKRRTIVKGGVTSAFAAIAGAFGREDAEAKGCKGKDANCDKDGDCCSKKCGGGKCKCSKNNKRCKKASDCCNSGADCTSGGGGNKKCFVS